LFYFYKIYPLFLLKIKIGLTLNQITSKICDKKSNLERQMVMTVKLYGNTPCFLGAENVSKSKNLSGVDAVVYGVPWEGAVTWGDYTGCELGPKVIRLCSARYSGYLPELDHIDV